MVKSFKVIKAFLKQGYDYSSVQFELPEELAEEICDWGYTNIPQSILTKDGFEKNKHITIKYGIHIIDFTEIRELFKNEKPVKAVLGDITLFEDSDGFDVIKIDVVSPKLHQLNKSISKHFEVTNTHPIYRPHVTIAYVRKGCGEPFKGNNTFNGRNMLLDTVLFSGKDNRETVFKLLH